LFFNTLLRSVGSVNKIVVSPATTATGDGCLADKKVVEQGAVALKWIQEDDGVPVF
jgi:hypothetical protein